MINVESQNNNAWMYCANLVYHIWVLSHYIHFVIRVDAPLRRCFTTDGLIYVFNSCT